MPRLWWQGDRWEDDHLGVARRGTTADSVGVWASIDHLAPALIGDRIAIHATVKILDGRRVTFDTTIMRAEKIIGLMQHTRTVVSVADLQTRLKQL